MRTHIDKYEFLFLGRLMRLQVTCVSPAPSATISTITFPKATVSSQPPCRTDFMLGGACGWETEVRDVWGPWQIDVIQCTTGSFLLGFLCYLWVGELQSRDGEQDLAHSHEDVLRELPGDVHIVGLHVLHDDRLDFVRVLLKRTNMELMRLRSLLVPRSTHDGVPPLLERPCKPLQSPAGPGWACESSTGRLNIYSAAVQRRKKKKRQQPLSIFHDFSSKSTTRGRSDSLVSWFLSSLIVWGCQFYSHFPIHCLNLRHLTWEGTEEHVSNRQLHFLPQRVVEPVGRKPTEPLHVRSHRNKRRLKRFKRLCRQICDWNYLRKGLPVSFFFM